MISKNRAYTYGIKSLNSSRLRPFQFSLTAHLSHTDPRYSHLNIHARAHAWISVATLFDKKKENKNKQKNQKPAAYLLSECWQCLWWFMFTFPFICFVRRFHHLVSYIYFCISYGYLSLSFLSVVIVYGVCTPLLNSSSRRCTLYNQFCVLFLQIHFHHRWNWRVFFLEHSGQRVLSQFFLNVVRQIRSLNSSNIFWLKTFQFSSNDFNFLPLCDMP